MQGGGVAFSDETVAFAQNSNGPGSGFVGIGNLNTGQSIGCQAAMATFCGDLAFWINLDPGGQNLFFADADTLQISIGHIDWTNLTVVLSPSVIPGTPPPLFFSPDSKLVYAMNGADIGIYALQASSGNLTASTSLPISGTVSVACIVRSDSSQSSVRAWFSKCVGFRKTPSIPKVQPRGSHEYSLIGWQEQGDSLLCDSSR